MPRRQRRPGAAERSSHSLASGHCRILSHIDVLSCASRLFGDRVSLANPENGEDCRAFERLRHGALPRRVEVTKIAIEWFSPVALSRTKVV